MRPLGFLTPFGPRKINEVLIDAVLEETPAHSVAVTDHPIEVPSRGGVSRGRIVDNAYVEPSTYTMTGVVSDTPITFAGAADQVRRGTAVSRSLSAYSLMLEHLRTRTPFTLLTPFGPLENMLFTLLKAPRSADTAGGIRFFAEFREVQLVVVSPVTSERAPDDVTGDQAEARAVGVVDRGQEAGAEVDSGSVAGRAIRDVLDAFK